MEWVIQSTKTMSVVSVTPANVIVSITKTDTHNIGMICKKAANNKVTLITSKIESMDLVFVSSRSAHGIPFDLNVFSNTWVEKCYEVTPVGATIKNKTVKDAPVKVEKSPEYLALQAEYAELEKKYFKLLTVGSSESKNSPAKGKGGLVECRKCKKKTYSYKSGCINKECDNKRSPKNITKTDDSASEASE